MMHEEITASARMFVEQNAWMFKPEGMAPAAELIALMITEAERRGREQAKDDAKLEPIYDYTICKAETGYRQERIGEYKRTVFMTCVLDGWEPYLFDNGQVIMRRKQKESER